MPLSDEPIGYVLIKRGYYWKPNSRGYTAFLSEAGIYTDEESRGYAGGSHDGMTYRLPIGEAAEISASATDEQKAKYWQGRTAALLEENASLREELKPFSVAAGGVFTRNFNASDVLFKAVSDGHEDSRITAGDLFKARAALSSSLETKGDGK